MFNVRLMEDGSRRLLEHGGQRLIEGDRVRRGFLMSDWTFTQEDWCEVVEFAEGTGWSADAIAEVWPKQFAAAQQTVGQQFPEPPK